MAQTRAKLPNRYAYKFQLFYSMCENVYLDCLSNRTVLGYYTEAHRKHTIINIFDAGDSDGLSYIIMELLDMGFII